MTTLKEILTTLWHYVVRAFVAVRKHISAKAQAHDERRRKREEAHKMRMKTDRYYRWEYERKKEERDEFRSRIIGALFATPFCVVFFVFLYEGCKSTDEKFEEDYMKGAEEYVNFNPMSVSPVALNESSSVGSPEDIPVWTNKGGDYKACREQLLADIKADEKRRGITATTLEAKIDGDTLYLWAYYLKDSYNRDLLAKEMKKQFEDCDFYRVLMGTHYSKPADYVVEEHLNLPTVHRISNRRELRIFEKIWGPLYMIRERLDEQDRLEAKFNRKLKTTWENKP